MDDHEIERIAERIKSSGRRRRPNGRWSNPASPLQAARFELRRSGKEVITAIRKICKGHTPGQPCRIDVSKLSDYETGNRRPGLEHIEAFCRYYQRYPEQLGLIAWRDEPEPSPSASSSTHNGSGTNGLHLAIPSGEVAGLPEHTVAGDASVDQLLVHLLSEAAALTAATTQLLRVTLHGRTPEADDAPQVML
jgi:hypothetical protein